MVQFDTYTDDHPQTMSVEWYRGTTLLTSETYNVDNAMYFCNTPVTAYNKIVITIGNMTRANRYLKIFNITDGISRQFYNDELENVEIIEQITNNVKALNINEASLRILPQSDAGILFQRTLPFSIYRNEVLLGKFFVNTSTSNTDKTLFSVKVNDYISMLEGQSYLGGLYSNATVSSVIADILGTIPYTLDSTLGAKTISGYLPITNKREALRQVAFCVNALVDTSRSTNIIIKPLPTTVARTIPQSEIVSIETTEENITTRIELLTTSLVTKKRTEVDDILTENLRFGTTTVIFDNPMFDLEIRYGEILSSNINYAIIKGNSNYATTLSGKEYQLAEYTTSKSNPYVVTTDVEKLETYQTTLTCDTPAINNLQFVQYKIKSTFLMRDTKVGDLVNLNGQVARVMSLSYSADQTAIWCKAELEAYYE